VLGKKCCLVFCPVRRYEIVDLMRGISMATHPTNSPVRRYEIVDLMRGISMATHPTNSIMIAFLVGISRRLGTPVPKNDRST
jgi:hypothetical protein